MLDNLLNRWHSTSAYRNYAMRDPNERMIILAVVLLIGAVLIWTLLWQPVSDWSAQSQENHQREQTLNDWLVANESRARASAGDETAPRTAAEGLLTIVSRTAEQSGLKLTRFQPESNGVSVVLQKQAFNDVLRWLNLLENDEQVLVVQASVDADTLSGRVNARFSLRR